MSKQCVYNYSYDHPHILAGQGTMGLEVVEQVPDMDAIIIPVGGAGLIAGAALAIKSLQPHVKVIVSTFMSKTRIIYVLKKRSKKYL